MAASADTLYPAAILRSLGLDPMTDVYTYRPPTLTIPFVSQADLDAAITAYDPLPDERKIAHSVLDTERNKRVDAITGDDRDKLAQLTLATNLQQKQIAHLKDPANNPPLTSDEEGLVASMEGVVSMISAHDSVRDTIGSEIDSATTVDEVKAIVANIPTDTRWP